MQPISVVIPYFNQGRYLGESLRSVFAQTHAPQEIVVVDDGSRPEESKAIDEFRSHPLVRVHRQENQGLSAARNSGLLIARHPWIAFLDSDDVWMPRHLELVTRPLQDPRVGVSFGRMHWMDEAGKPLGIVNRKSIEVSLRELILRNPAGCGSTFIVKREVFDKVGLFQGYLCEDYDLLLRTATQSRWKIRGVEDVTVYYRRHSGSLSHQRWKMVLAKKRILKSILPRIAPALRAWAALAMLKELVYFLAYPLRSGWARARGAR